MIKLKDLRTAYNVLDALDTQVPRELLAYIADSIRQKESELNERRMSRMSDEDFIRLESRQKRTLRINTPDGRLFQKKTNEDTFRAIMSEADLKQVYEMMLTVRNKPLLLFSPKHKRIKGYVTLRDGYFLRAKSNSEEKVTLLSRIDEKLRLNWEILLI